MAELFGHEKLIVYQKGMRFAACLDVLGAKGLMPIETAFPGKLLLSEIVCIIVAMRKTAASRFREEYAPVYSQRHCSSLSKEETETS